MADGRLDGIRFRPAALTPLAVRGSHDEARSLNLRIRSEFEEMPGTSLTVPQACRLFGMTADVGAGVLRTLVDDGVLRVTRDGRYLLRSSAA